jgi:hypothetical protein
VKPRIFLAITNLGWINTTLTQRVRTWLNQGEVTQIWDESNLRPIPHARNTAVESFLDSDCTHLLIVECDIKPPLNAVKELLRANKDVVTGIARKVRECTDGYMRPVPIVATRNERGTFSYVHEPKHRLEKIDRCGSACILIRRHILEDVIAKPWYEQDSSYTTTSDFVFCEKLEKAGIELWAHYEVNCRHIMEVEL